MSSACYKSVFSSIDPTIQPLIASALKELYAQQNPGQIKKNVEAETALSTVDFSSLLESFAVQLQQGNLPENAWQTACRLHQFKGPRVPPTLEPSTLGRVKGFDAHVFSISNATGALAAGMTPDRIKKLLLKYSGSHSAPNFEPLLRKALLGEYLIWATFDVSNNKQNPFDKLPITRTGLCGVLGLGLMLNNNEPLILLVWDHATSGTPPLYRPTIADACDYSFFRPHPNPNNAWGMTEPLQPNTENFMPQPEIVMPTTASSGLKLPYLVVHV